jgi:hypothetical protein
MFFFFKTQYGNYVGVLNLLCNKKRRDSPPFKDYKKLYYLLTVTLVVTVLEPDLMFIK